MQLCSTPFLRPHCCVFERACVVARLSGAVDGPSLEGPVYGISYYGIPNFVQALCLTGYLAGRLFDAFGLDVFCECQIQPRTPALSLRERGPIGGCSKSEFDSVFQVGV
ncbi:hypothetical protein EMIT0P265_10021 [Pseudomonas zeae]